MSFFEDSDEPILIGVGGPPYAGKSRLAKSLNRLLHGRYQVFYLSSERDSYKSVRPRIDNGKDRSEANMSSFMTRFDDPPLKKVLERIETIRSVASARKRQQEMRLMQLTEEFELDEGLELEPQVAVPEPLTPRQSDLSARQETRKRVTLPEGSLLPRPPEDAPPEAAFFRQSWKMQSSHFFSSVTATFNDYEFVPMAEPLAVAIKQRLTGKNYVFVVGTTFLASEEVRKRLDHSFYLNISEEQCFARLVERNSRLKVNRDVFEPQWSKFAKCTEMLLKGIYFINAERPPPVLIVEILRHLLQGSPDFADAPIDELKVELSEKELQNAVEELKAKDDVKDERWWAHALRDKSLESIKAALALEK